MIKTGRVQCRHCVMFWAGACRYGVQRSIHWMHIRGGSCRYARVHRVFADQYEAAQMHRSPEQPRFLSFASGFSFSNRVNPGAIRKCPRGKPGGGGRHGACEG